MGQGFANLSPSAPPDSCLFCYLSRGRLISTDGSLTLCFSGFLWVGFMVDGKRAGEKVGHSCLSPSSRECLAVAMFLQAWGSVEVTLFFQGYGP